MKDEVEYNKADQRVIWHNSAGVGEALDTDRARELSAALRSGEWKGQPVKDVQVRFGSETAAAYHADALSFLQLAAFAGGRRVEAKATFRAREDFGIDGK